MRGRKNPQSHLFGKGLHSWAPRNPMPPTEAQIRVAKDIAERERVNIPKVYTRQAYAQFIRNYGKKR